MIPKFHRSIRVFELLLSSAAILAHAKCTATSKKAVPERSVNAVIHDPPLAGFVAEDHPLGSEVLVPKRGPKQDAFVLSVRRTRKFMGEGRADKRTRDDSTERHAPSFH